MAELLSNVDYLLTLLTIVFVLFLSIVVYRMKNKNQIHYAFMVLMATVFVWALGAAILATDSLQGHPTRTWVVYLAYVGLILTPEAILFLGLVFAKSSIKLSWRYALLLIIPAISIFMLFTNEFHHLFYESIEYSTLTDVGQLGIYFLIHTLYSYSCITIGMVYLIYFSIKNAGFFSRQSILIAVGIISSFLYNILITVQVIKVDFHTNVIAFFIPLVLFYFGILRFNFLSIMPIALQNVVDHISDCYLVIDKNLSVIEFNRPFQDKFSNILKINRGETLDQLINRENNPEAVALLRRFKDFVVEQIPVSYEKSLLINGLTTYFTIEITPIFVKGAYISTIILLKDITEIKQASELIQKNYEMLAEKERLASLGQLIGGIAHNLKTPIMSISGGIEGLKDLISEYKDSIGNPAVLDEDHKAIANDMMGWVKKMGPHCSYMSAIISTVKGQTAQFANSQDLSFTLDELIKRVELLMMHELKSFHCILKISNQMDQFTELRGDVNSLVQIIDNLIINSIHAYSGKSGEIHLEIQEKNSGILFTLKDFGKGIEAAIQQKLFREMVTTKGKNGTGLGLYMSHSTIKGQFGGNMWFESQIGQGTTFFIEIPLKH